MAMKWAFFALFSILIWVTQEDYMKSEKRISKKIKVCAYCSKEYRGTRDNETKWCSIECRIRAHSDIDDRGCWVWKGKIRESGYGIIYIKRKKLRAHRISYKTFVGELKPGWEICHTCDNKKCVNPLHLWQGTSKQNIVDRFVKYWRSKKKEQEGQLSLL